MHPSSDGRFSVVRFTAPTDGNYTLDVTFTHIHSCALKSGAYIVYNDLMMLWEINLDGLGDSKSFKSNDSGVSVRANEPIDFIVGVGLDNIYNCDMTLARVDIHLLKNSTIETQTNINPTNTNPTNTNPTNTNPTNEVPMNENQMKLPVGIVVSLVISAILFYVYYRYRKNKQNNNRNLNIFKGPSGHVEEQSGAMHSDNEVVEQTQL